MCEKCIEVSDGPVSTMPGSRVAIDCGTMCHHHNRPAVYRVQGETDSFGCEYVFLCEECADNVAARVNYSTCDMCHGVAEVRAWRDPEEGMAGPIYYVCQPCRVAHAKRMREELGDEDDDQYSDWPELDPDSWEDDEPSDSDCEGSELRE